METAGIEQELIFSYVDDIREILLALKRGVDFCGKCKMFTLTREQEETDRESMETDTARTARIMLKVFNSIETDLNFTVETKEDYANNMLPTLDTTLSMVTKQDLTMDSMEGWGEGSPSGNQRVSQQLEVPPSNWSPSPPLGPPSGCPNGEPGAQHPGVGPGPSMEGQEVPPEDTRPGCTRMYKQIEYRFFTKPTGSKFVILENSAAPFQQKKSVLAQETVRRLMNTAEETDLNTRLSILNTFDDKMKRSGYSSTQRKEIIESGIVGYKRKIIRQKGVRQRKGTETLKTGRKKKLAGKRNWFRNRKKQDGDRKRDEKVEKDKTKKAGKNLRDRKKGKDETDRTPAAVIFIPRTQGGELARRIREIEKDLAKHSLQTVKVVERNGDRIEHLLVKVDPLGDPLCQRPECFSCKTTDKDQGKCRQTNIVYRIQCNPCNTLGSKVNYWGETSRSAFERGAEHLGSWGRQSQLLGMGAWGLIWS